MADTQIKLFIIQERGRHARNRDYREALSLARALERAGCAACVWGLGYDNFARPFAEASADCDAVLTLENYDSGWHPELASCRLPKLFWSIDSHCALEAHLAFCRRHKIDYLLNSTEAYIYAFKGLVAGSAWLPNAIDADLIRAPEGARKEHDLGFCGSLIAGRGEWLARLGRELDIKTDIGALGADMVRAVSGYRIGLNRCIADDINYRVFEVPACGSMLVTNRVPNLEKLFEPGREIAVYDDEAQLIELCRHYLANPSELQAISAAGTRAVFARHTYDQRAGQLIGILRGLC